MTGYTKLFASIVTSTIWREPNEVRLVWITMLALADKTGEVHGSVPGLADMARVSVEACEQALQVLMAPDKHSRTKDFDGRRIEEVDGVGWQLLNHAKYRHMMSADERREYFRLKKQQQRERDVKKCPTLSKTVKDVSPDVMDNPQCPHIAEAESKEQKAKSRSKYPAESDAQVNEIYQAYPRKEAKPEALKAIRKALTKAPFTHILEKTKAYAESPKVKQAISEGTRNFIPHAATWFNQERYDDDPIFWEADKPAAGYQKPKSAFGGGVC